MATSETIAKHIVWLQRTRLGCVAIFLFVFIVSSIPFIMKEGLAAGIGYMVAGVLISGGIPFVLWTFAILIYKTVMLRWMTIPSPDPQDTDESSESGDQPT